jgi:hypothetical protein
MLGSMCLYRGILAHQVHICLVQHPEGAEDGYVPRFTHPVDLRGRQQLSAMAEPVGSDDYVEDVHETGW